MEGEGRTGIADFSISLTNIIFFVHIPPCRGIKKRRLFTLPLSAACLADRLSGYVVPVGYFYNFYPLHGFGRSVGLPVLQNDAGIRRSYNLRIWEESLHMINQLGWIKDFSSLKIMSCFTFFYLLRLQNTSLQVMFFLKHIPWTVKP